MTDRILIVRDLRTYFWDPAEHQFIRAVDGADFSIPRGQTLGLIGESGSGKSVTAQSILGVVRDAPGVIGGKIIFHGQDHVKHNLLKGLNVELEREDTGVIVKVTKNQSAWLRNVEKQMKTIRGKGISMVFQESTAALNPVFTVGEQLVETLRRYYPITKKVAKKAAVAWLNAVRIDNPTQRLRQYPSELSGGMRQRVMIALALCTKPSLLIADEPTTGLDATTQREIINLLQRIKAEFKISMLIITHDLGVIDEIADSVAVMYGGRTMEYGAKADILDACKGMKHPYTGGLLAAVESIKPIQGEVFSPKRLMLGCRFAERCNICEARCRAEEPPLKAWEDRHFVRCWKADQWKMGQPS